MKKFVIMPENVCADRILVTVQDDDTIEEVVFEGGCDGNSKAIGQLLKNMPVEKVVALLSGIDCEGKGTSCADQLAQGLRERQG